MEKRSKRIEAESELPEEIIQHIQSFLNGKEAAQTTLLSRSWYQAWLTRPNLDFDEEQFAIKSDSDHDFWKLVTTAVERYANLNIKIDSLRLWIHKEHSLVNELIIKALKVGASCLDFKMCDEYSRFTFPHQVFGFENLTRLSIRDCKIAREDNGRLIIRCSRLKYLNLEYVGFFDNIIWDIISSCPLMEDFSLTLSTVFSRKFSPEFFGKQHILNEFHKLKSLYLSKVRVDPSYFDHFSCKFPRLKNLTLYDCDCGTYIIQISSPSLECIIFASWYTIRGFKFDVPRIRKFIFMGSNIPLLSFEKTTSNWMSHIHIECFCALSATWFVELNGLLKKLRSSDSKVGLHLYTRSEKVLEFSKEVPIYCDSKPEVFHMTVNGPYAAFPELYCSLFKCCRPSSIEPDGIPWFTKKRGYNDIVSEFVWKRKIQQACFDGCIAYQRMSDCDLRKLKVDFYDESVSEWRTRLVDATSTTSIRDVAGDEQAIFFRLKWGPKILRIRRELES